MIEGHIWIISTESDQLSVYVSKKLKDVSIPVLFSEARTVSELELSLTDEKLYVNNKLITGILLRAKPDSFFSESFIDQDRQFCDSEIGALLLASINLPSILSINKYDAQLWFDRSSWAVLRSRFLHNNIKVAPFHFGKINLNMSSVWLPYNSFIFRISPHIEIRKILGTALTESLPSNRYLIVGNNILNANSNHTLNNYIELLFRYGIYISEIVTDSNGNVITINTLPLITEKKILDDASNLLVKKYYDFMSRW